MYKKTTKFLKYEYTIANKIDNESFLGELPISLRNEIMHHMYRDIIHNFVYLKEGDFLDDTLFVKEGVLSLEINVK